MELYHGTVIQNLNTITPQYDGHEKTPYVFATPNFASALRYVTAEKGNLYFGIENNTAIIVEKFPYAFERTYRNASGTIYVLPSTNFQLTKLKHRIEYIATKPITPTSTIKIENTAEKLLDAESKGYIKIYYYPHLPSGYIPYKENIFQKIKRFFYKNFSNKNK